MQDTIQCKLFTMFTKRKFDKDEIPYLLNILQNTILFVEGSLRSSAVVFDIYPKCFKNAH